MQPTTETRFARSDEELLLEFRQSSDRHCFEQLVRRYEREMYTFLRRFLNDEQLAEDAFQATFLALFLRADQFEEGRRFRPWLYAIATNKAIDCQRRRKKVRVCSLDAEIANRSSEGTDTLSSTLVDDSPDPVVQAAFQESGARVRQALNELSAPTQQLIQMAFYQGMKYSDIGETLGIPVGTVKSRVHTAMKKLQAAWYKLFPTESVD